MFRLGPGAPQEKLNRVVHSLGEFVRPGEVNGPLADHGVEKAFHEFGEMDDGKIPGDLSVFLALRDNFAQEAHRRGFRSSQFWRAHRIHRTGEDYGLPKRPAHFRDVSQTFVKPAQALLGGGFRGQFGFQALGLAREGAASDFTQYRILARKIAEKCGLADFEGVNDVVYAGLLVTALAEKMEGGFNDLLAQALLLAFAKAGHVAFSRSMSDGRRFGYLVVDVFRRCWRTSQNVLGAAHDSCPPAWFAAWARGIYFDSGHIIRVTNAKLQAPRGVSRVRGAEASRRGCALYLPAEL